MNSPAAAGSRFWTWRRFQRLAAFTAAVFLVSVQVVLACHVGSHLHLHDESGDCGLCVIDSQFVAQPVAILDFQAGESVLFRAADSPGQPSSDAPLSPAARAPPGASV